MNKPHPYYDRPSKQSSFQIAVICLIGLVLMILGLMVSEVVSDFDNTSINKKVDPIADTFVHKETISKRMLKRIKGRTINKSVSRALNEQ